MADDTPPSSSSRPPVRMGLRVVARHSAGRHGGRALARGVAEAHRPKLLDAATRLSRSSAPPAPPAPPSSSPAPPAAEFAAPPVAADPASERPSWAPPEMSAFAASFMFGNQSPADQLVSMAQAEKMPEPTKEQKLARFRARGGLERSRGARIVEGAGRGVRISSEELGLSRWEAPAEPALQEPAKPLRLSARP